MEKRYWIYVVIAGYLFINKLVAAPFSIAHLVGVIIDTLITAGIIVLIIEALYRKFGKKK